MDEIRELYALVKMLSGRKDRAIPFFFSKKHQYTKLLEGIISGKYHDDAQAAADLTPELHEKDKSYRKTKQLLIDKLLVLLCALNIRRPNFSLYLVNNYSAKREILAAEVLQWFGLHKALYYIITRRTLKKARKYDLTEIEYKCYQLLRNYASKYGSIEECEYYARKVNETLCILAAEARAENVLRQIDVHFRRQMSPNPDVVAKFVGNIERLKEEVDLYRTRTLLLNYYIAAGLAFRLHGNFTKAYEIYQEYMTYLNNNPHMIKNIRKAEVCYYLVRCCLWMRDYKNGFRFATMGAKLPNAGTRNWFSFMEAYCLLCIHSRRYNKAAEIFRWVIDQKSFTDNKVRVEIWGIIEAYIRLFLGTADATALPESCTVYGKMFNVNRLLNEIDETRQDKRGMNVAILIFQILHLLKEKKYEALNGRISYVRDYVRKVIRRDHPGLYYRTDCFFQMLAKAQECRYSLAATHEATQELLQSMTAFRATDTYHCIMVEEIVPHEQSWAIFVHELKRGELNRAPQEGSKKETAVKTL